MKTFDREGQIWNCLCGNGCFGTVLELSSFCGWIITVITHRPPSRSLIATHQTSERPCHGQIWRSREACAKSKSKSHLLLHPSHRWASPYWGSALSSSQNRVHCQLYCMWVAILDGIALVLASIAIVIASSTISMAAQQCPPDAFSFQIGVKPYPNWFNSIFEFRQKMIQFNIQFNTISQKINSENYSIQKNLRKFNSKNYSIQKISKKFNSKNYSIQ